MEGETVKKRHLPWTLLFQRTFLFQRNKFGCFGVAATGGREDRADSVGEADDTVYNDITKY